MESRVPRPSSRVRRIRSRRTLDAGRGTRDLVTVLICIAATCCAGNAPELRGVAANAGLVVDIYPNPIVARHLHGNLYEFPFEVSLRETGGADLEIDGVRVEVRLRGAPIFAQVFDETELTRRGFSTTVPASGNVQYRFAPRREVTSDVIFSHVAAEVTVAANSRDGRRVEGSTVVTVRR